MRNPKFFILFLAFAMTFAVLTETNFANASVTANSSFYLEKKAYNPGEQIKAAVNFGLLNEPADSKVVISINLKNTTLKLRDFLSQAGIADYNCTNNCKNIYETAGTGQSEIVLKEGQNLIGVKFFSEEEKQMSAEDFQFKLSPLAGETFGKGCGESVVKIDMLDDGIDWRYLEPKAFSADCNGLSFNEECFRQDLATDFTITSSLYCEKKFLGETSKIKLAAKVRKALESSKGDLKIILKGEDMSLLGECDLTEPTETEYSAENCLLDYAVKEPKDYYICISDDKYKEDGGAYYILGERTMPLCGFVNSPSGIKVDFALQAQIAEIKEFSAFIFNSSEYEKGTESDLISDMNTYLSSYYSKLCEKGCVVPVSITTKEKAKISGMQAGYSVEGLSYPPVSFPVYNVTKKAPLISTGKNLISMDFLNLAIQETGSYKITFSIGDNVFSSLDLNVSSIPKIYSVSPQNPIAGIETSFLANAVSLAGYTLTSYEWDFGDGTVKTTSNNTCLHTYPAVTEYNLTLTVKDEKGTEATLSFTIKPETPKKAVNDAIIQKKSFLNNFSTAIGALPPWYMSIIAKEIGFSDMKEKIETAEKDAKEAEETGQDEVFLDIKSRLDNLIVPLSIEDTQILEETGVLPFINEINPGNIKELGGGSYNEDLIEETKNAIVAWQPENLNMKINGVVKTITFEDLTTRNVLTSYNLNLIPLKSPGNAYLVIILPSGMEYEDIAFEKNYGQKKLTNAIGIPVNLESSQTVNFAMPGEQSIAIPIFASPSLDSLTIIPKLVACGNGICEKEYGENYKNCIEDCPATARTIKLILAVFLMGAISIFLIWKFYAVIYDRKEQSRIFKSRKNYISILIFISDALNKGFNEGQIGEKLKKAGWNNEQIEYALSKSKKAEKKAKKKLEGSKKAQGKCS